MAYSFGWRPCCIELNLNGLRVVICDYYVVCVPLGIPVVDSPVIPSVVSMACLFEYESLGIVVDILW